MRVNSINFANSNINFKKVYENKKPNPNQTVVILGASKDTSGIIEYDYNCAQVTKELVLEGKNILTGCGTGGIMGAAYKAAKANSKIIDGKPAQNLAIIPNHLWGDEDLDNCTIIGEADSELERIADFNKCADTFVIYPGGAGTIQEATSLIFENRYSNANKKIILVGREYFKGLDEQYQTLYRNGQCKNPSKLYTIVENPNEVLDCIEK